MGGLGNQLFQYAAGFALAHKNKCELKIDLCSFANQSGRPDTVRDADILQFRIGSSVVSHQEANAHRNPYGVVSRAMRFLRQKVFKQYYSDWHPEILRLKGDVYLEGYFQCEKYFEEFNQLLSHELCLLSNLEKGLVDLQCRLAKLRNSVSLHVRRGDYVSDPKISALHNICTKTYYQNAISEMSRRVGEFDLVVFSDDVSWVRENLDLVGEVWFLSGEKTVNGAILSAPQELTLMSHCKHHIISNSTFSWWGAYLNPCMDKVVIAPALWNRSAVDHHKNILPETWLRVPIE